MMHYYNKAGIVGRSGIGYPPLAEVTVVTCNLEGPFLGMREIAL
jgi:hypothetical protein